VKSPNGHGRYEPYDLIKEVVVAFLACSCWSVAPRAVLLADDKQITMKSWSSADPSTVAQTAITELDGTSGTAGYGPPYNSTAGASQHFGPISPESWLGVQIPIDTAQDFVVGPARDQPNKAELAAAVSAYTSASSTSRRRGRRPTRRRLPRPRRRMASSSCRPATTGRSGR